MRATRPQVNLLKRTVVNTGYRAQRFARTRPPVRIYRFADQAPPSTTGGKPPLKAQVIPLHQQTDARWSAKQTARKLLDIEDDKVVPIIHNPKLDAHERKRVLFPSCGSERLFSGRPRDAGDAGGTSVQTVLPPGYPAAATADSQWQSRQGRRSPPTTGCCSIVCQYAELPRYQDGDRELRRLYGSPEVPVPRNLPGCRLLDIHEYLLEKGVKLRVSRGHATCTMTLPHDQDAGADEGGRR